MAWLGYRQCIKWKPTKENQREIEKLQCKYETIVILSDGNVTFQMLQPLGTFYITHII